ncbi:BTAD domain-containing putative transcriptional regulator [Nitrosospira sp. Is2]|uniref:BTAD domain-containing putative transcriptional regulator n=1 Tax=Nitrosospira sp. Is2 TaxID=3080532 RepID=UPI0029541C9C|nr:BTAD domain-containing putative transcriptional regulator [Nitrosospira sp. Is2]WON74181.1 BTAD domain-containing putative transcriptional regulator [Nitrosospira sp. Is2]
MTAVEQHLAKITIPQPHRAYARTRLFELLDTARQQRIVWIAAPPGAGKTTLASTYLAARSLKASWCQLDTSDGDVASFFHYLAIAVETASPRYRTPLPSLTPEYLSGLPTFTRRFFEKVVRRLGTPAVIVLDNYQEVASAAPLHEVLREAAESLPGGVSFLILSRSDPPTSLARFQLHGDLVFLGWDELQLTLAEAQSIASLRAPDSAKSRIEELHRLTQGWVAGLRLLLDQDERTGFGAQLESGKAQQVLFDYFATEVFERWSLSIQTALLRTALLSVMTVPQAEQLAGETNIGRVLADLHRSNYFVVLRMDDEPRYEYHSLFREFLLSRAQKTFNQAEWRTLQCQAAELLGQSNETAAAASLYYASQHWEGLRDLILREASGLITAGRHQTLLQWLNWLPQVEFEHTPWLWYWRGLARLPFNPIDARRIFEQAYLGFQAEDDSRGLYLTWAGVMDTFFFEWRDFTPVDRWIAEFEQLRIRHPEFPSRAVELRTYWSIGTLMHRQPHHPFLRIWAERGLGLLDITDRDLSILLGGYLIVCFLWWGETVRARDVIDRLNSWTKSPDISPLVFILWSCAVALYYSVRGEMDACVAAVEGGLELAQRTGLHAFDFLLRAQAARCSLIAGKLAEAEHWMLLMAKAMRSHSHIDGTFYQHLKSNAAAQRGDWQQSIEHARMGLAMSMEAGTPFPEAHCRIDLARALIGQGDDAESTEQLHYARAIGQAMGSRVLEYLCIETAALAAFERGQEDEGHKQLIQALAISRAMDGATWLLEGPQVSAYLYNRALAAGIQVDHVQRLIRQHRLTPPDPATAAKLWPWPVKVYTLGRFDVLCDDQRLPSSRKSPHKSLELLKCLCAFGGRSINQDRITEALWPDGEGDAAEQALSTTLHRLRKLLKYEHAIRLEDRHISFDPNYIWVDCLAFNRAAHHPSITDRLVLQHALSLYRGHFLEGETSPWALALRDQVRARYLSMAEQLGDIFERDNDWKSAAECYLGVIAVEPAAEIFYRRLMSSYAQQGRRTEALVVYRRCRQSLLAQLGVCPTEETQNLYQVLSNS